MARDPAWPWPTGSRPVPAQGRQRPEAPFGLWPSAGESVCRAGRGPSSGGPGARRGALPSAGAGADCLWPDTGRPRPLRPGHDGHGEAPSWSCDPAAARSTGIWRGCHRRSCRRCRGFRTRVRAARATRWSRRRCTAPAPSLEGLDHGSERQVVPCSWLRVQAAQTFRLFGDGLDLFLKDHLRCRAWDTHLAAPAQVGRAPVGLPCRADIVPPHERLPTPLRCFNPGGDCPRPRMSRTRHRRRQGQRLA